MTNTTIHPTDLEALQALRQAGIFRLSSAETTPSDHGWHDGIAECHHDNGRVTLLNLGSCRLHRGFGTCTTNDLQRMFGTPFFTCLTSINLGGTNARMADVLTILQACSNGLETVYLGGNGMGPVGAASLAQFVQEHADQTHQWRKLDLRYNDLGPTGCTALCEALLATTTTTTTTKGLKQLYLEGNDIGDDGAKALAKLLQSPLCTLQEVFLGANQIGPEGARALATAIATNNNHSSLEKLYIEGNHIGPEGAEAFTTALLSMNSNAKQRTLKHLYCDNNDIGKEGSKRLAQALNSDTAISGSLLDHE